MTLALFAGTVGANAAIVTGSWSPLQSTGLFFTNGDDQTLTFDKFSGPGTLTKVEFELTGYAEAGYSVSAFLMIDDEPFNVGDVTFQFQGIVTVNLQNPLGGNFVVSLPTPSDIERTVTDGDTYSTPGYPLRSLTDSDAVSAQTVNPADLALFIGGLGDTISLTTNATINTQFNADNDYTQTVSSRAQSSGRIRYTWDDGGAETPEPTSMVLGGSALLGIGLLGRRRAAKK